MSSSAVQNQTSVCSRRNEESGVDSLHAFSDVRHGDEFYCDKEQQQHSNTRSPGQSQVCLGKARKAFQQNAAHDRRITGKDQCEWRIVNKVLSVSCNVI